jgi:hypothetical protein
LNEAPGNGVRPANGRGDNRRREVLPAASLVLAISGAPGCAVTLDGKARWLSGGNPGLLAVDLTRSTGFHYLEVGRESTWFGTEDANLRLAGIEAMLAQLRTSGTAWSGQALFSNGQGYATLTSSTDGSISGPTEGSNRQRLCWPRREPRR